MRGRKSLAVALQVGCGRCALPCGPEQHWAGLPAAVCPLAKFCWHTPPWHNTSWLVARCVVCTSPLTLFHSKHLTTYLSSALRPLAEPHERGVWCRHPPGGAHRLGRDDGPRHGCAHSLRAVMCCLQQWSCSSEAGHCAEQPFFALHCKPRMEDPGCEVPWVRMPCPALHPCSLALPRSRFRLARHPAPQAS